MNIQNLQNSIPENISHPGSQDFLRSAARFCCNTQNEWPLILILVITGGHEQCQQPKGKFHIKDDNTPDICIADDLVVNWNEILETKLVFP